MHRVYPITSFECTWNYWKKWRMAAINFARFRCYRSVVFQKKIHRRFQVIRSIEPEHVASDFNSRTSYILG